MREMDCFFQTDLFIADTAHGFGIITGLEFCHEKSGVWGSPVETLGSLAVC